MLAAIPTLLAASAIVFSILHLVPGDPAAIILGVDASAEQVARVRATLELDQPVLHQYWRYLVRLVRGDWGRSIWVERPVLEEILPRMGNTILLSLLSMGLAVICGIALGVASAVRQRSVVDYAAVGVVSLGTSMPAFWLGLMSILLFSVKLQVFPVGGKGSLTSYVLPASTLAAFSMGIFARMTRSSLLNVLREEYVMTARSKGLPELRVIWRHALKNALIPIISLVGTHFGYMLGGAVVTETVFAWPGLGRLVVDAILVRDYPLVQGALLLITLMFISVNLIVDVTYAWADPRIRAR